MSLQKKCCCGTCFFGASSLNPDATACAHNQTEILNLKIPRPAYHNDRFVIAYGGTGCSCEASFLKSTLCPESPTIEVEYEHFHPSGRTYTWFYERDYEVWPPCEGAPCCGYENLTYDDAQCCQDGVLCYPTYRTWDGDDCSRYQGAAIAPGTIPHLGSLADSEDCSVGDSYWFLQNVADHPQTSKFDHWEVVGGVVTAVSSRSLEQTMLCVVHKEKWWERDYNSLSQTDNPSASDIDNAAANCRTPKYWVFACSGIPLYTWEIKQLSSLSVPHVVTVPGSQSSAKSVSHGLPEHPGGMSPIQAQSQSFPGIGEAVKQSLSPPISHASECLRGICGQSESSAGVVDQSWQT